VIGPPRRLAFQAQASQGQRERIAELLPLVQELADADLREAVVQIWAHAWRISHWRDPADVPFLPDLAQWRLVDHVNSVALGCDQLAASCRQALGLTFDRDLLLASALLHDVAKLVELEPGPEGAVESEVGRAVHHATVGAQWALEAGLPWAMAQAIFTHTPVVSTAPCSPEGLMVHDVDHLVTRATRMAAAAPSPGDRKA